MIFSHENKILLSGIDYRPFFAQCIRQLVDHLRLDNGQQQFGRMDCPSDGAEDARSTHNGAQRGTDRTSTGMGLCFNISTLIYLN